MATKETRELYNGEIKIDFYPESHRYKMAGERTYLISVTSVTGVIDKSRFLIPWATRLASDFLIEAMERGEEITRDMVLEACSKHTERKEAAATAGTIVHAYAEEYAKAMIAKQDKPAIPEDAPEQALSGIIAFLNWVKEHDVTFHEAERMVYSKQHDFVGLTDAIVTIDGKRSLADYKTSKGIYDEHYFQTSAYWGAYEEECTGGEELDQAVLLHFDKESGDFTAYEMHRDEYEKNYPAFLGLLTARKRLKELAAQQYAR